MTLREALEHAAREQKAGRDSEAERIYRQILARRPDEPNATQLLAVILMRRGELDAATGLFRRALQNRSDSPDIWNNYGCALNDAGHGGEARKAFERALELNPDHAGALVNLGGLLERNGEVETGLEFLRRACAVAPESFDAWRGFGLACHNAGRHEDAVAAFRRALRLDPDHVPTMNGLAVALGMLGRYEDARTALDRALALEPDGRDARANQAVLAEQAGALDSAVAIYDQLLARFPGDPELIWNRGLVRLKQGDYGDGFAAYLHHHRLTSVPQRPAPPLALWDGKDVRGKRLLVRMEQGLGDMVQFARFVPLLAARGADVILESYRDLERLFSTLAGPQAVAGFDSVPRNADAYIPIMSLPHHLGITLESLPADIPYLAPPAEAAVDLPPAPPGAIRVGLVWSSNPAGRNARLKSCGLSDFASFAEIPGLALYSLQVGEHAAQLREAPFGRAIADLAPQLTDLAATAAATRQLDVIVTIDTVVAHLAGAMGARVWTLLPYAPDWRWMLDRPDSPWYPTMRLFRQPAPGDWATPISYIAAALSDMAFSESQP